jgi:hypothetical protein
MKFVEHQEEFMEAAEQSIDRPNKEQTELYLHEMLDAVGETMVATNPLRAADIRDLIAKLKTTAVASSRTDRVGLFANLIGVIMNAVGAGISAGLPMSSGWREVHRARMSDFAEPAKLSALLDRAA